MTLMPEAMSIGTKISTRHLWRGLTVWNGRRLNQKVHHRDLFENGNNKENVRHFKDLVESGVYSAG
jgi:hypothetical protein